MKPRLSAKKTSSQIIDDLFGDTRKVRKIMRDASVELKKSYNNKNLGDVFGNMDQRFICICPVTMYYFLLEDLGFAANRDVVKGIGLMCLAISTHDDVVDELPRERHVISRLIYAGNIAGLEGVRVLSKLGKNSLLDTISEAINKNHYFQQLVVEKLWDRDKLPNRREYLKGVTHITTFIRIGLMCALVEANRLDLVKSIEKFSESYGYALQLVDDIREVDEDRLSGYKSLPMAEGEPFKLSKKIALGYLESANKAVDSDWKNMKKTIFLMKAFFEREI